MKITKLSEAEARERLLDFLEDEPKYDEFVIVGSKWDEETDSWWFEVWAIEVWTREAVFDQSNPFLKEELGIDTLMTQIGEPTGDAVLLYCAIDGWGEEIGGWDQHALEMHPNYQHGELNANRDWRWRLS